MPPAYAPPRRTSGRSPVLIGGVALLVGAAGVIGTLLALGVEIPYLSAKKAVAASKEGMVAVPISAEAIPAYSRVARDHLIDKKDATIKVMWLYPHEVSPEMHLDFNKFLGRVLKHEKKAGYAFTEKDFYPPGTPAGVTAGVPPGKRAVVLEAEKIKGIGDLRQGDHFDILAAVELDTKAPAASTVSPNLITGNPLLGNPSATGAGAMKRAVSVPVVQNGVIVSPAVARQVPVSGAPPGPGGVPKTKMVQEVTIAVEADEVGWVSEALAVHAVLSCVARSAHPTPAAADGLVHVPVSTSAIPAYAKVAREHLVNPITRSFAVVQLRPEAVLTGTIRDANQLLGRVLKHEKPPGMVFAEDDFYPAGSPAGLTAGVPAGKRSFVFEAGKVQGIAALRQGDHFDIVSAVTVDDKLPASAGEKTVSLGVTGTPSKRAAVQAVVQNGVVLIPAAPRQVPVAGGQAKVVHEVAVAIDPDEVAGLTETLAVQTTLTCVARSGQASDQPDRDVPGKPVDVKVTTLETIVNGKRQVVQFAEPARPEGAEAPAPRPATTK